MRHGDRVQLGERLVDDEQEGRDREHDRQRHAGRRRRLAARAPRAPGGEGDQQRAGGVADVVGGAGRPAPAELRGDVDGVAHGDQRERRGEAEPGVDAPAARAPQHDGEAHQQQVAERVGEVGGAGPVLPHARREDRVQREDRGEGRHHGAADHPVQPQAGVDVHVARPDQPDHAGQRQRREHQPQRVGARREAQVVGGRELQVVERAAAGVQQQPDPDRAPGGALSGQPQRPCHARRPAGGEHGDKEPRRNDVSQPVHDPRLIDIPASRLKRARVSEVARGPRTGRRSARRRPPRRGRARDR